MNKPLSLLTLAVASGLAVVGVSRLLAENAAPSPSPAPQHADGKHGPRGDMRDGKGCPGGMGERGRWGHREGQFGRGPGGEMGPGPMMGHMLNLTDDQKAKVKAVMEANKPKIEAIRQEERAKIQAIMEDSQKQIRPILTPDQQQVMDDAMKLREGAEKLRADAQKLKAAQPAPATP